MCGPRRQPHNKLTPTLVLLEKWLKLVALFNGRCNKTVEGSEDPYKLQLYFCSTIWKLEKLTMATVPLVSNALRRYKQLHLISFILYTHAGIQMV